MTKGPRDDTRGVDSPEPGALSAAEATMVAIRQIADLTTREPLGATSVIPTNDGWAVEVEVVEDHRIPASTDMLALYEVELSLDGELLSYSRTRRYARGSGSSAS